MTAQIGQLERLLQRIDEHIDLDHCDQVDARHRRALGGEATDRPPLIVQAQWDGNWRLPEPWDRFEHYRDHQAYRDPIAMMQNLLLERVVPGLILKDDNPLAIRNNHGTIQVASVLGGRWDMREDNPPWIEPWGSDEPIRALVDRDEPLDLSGGVTGPSIKTLRFYAEQLARFPKCEQAVQISMPDLQGPFDTAEQLWGSDIYVAIMDQPSLVTALMEKVVRTMLEMDQLYRPYTRDRLEPFANSQHGYNIAGRLLIRNDSSILVSPDTYRNMIAPLDSRVLKAVGGGSLHFCGNGEHLIKPMLEIADLKGLDFGQSLMMDSDRIFAMCRERNVAITHHTPPREHLVDGTVRRRFPTGVVLVYQTQNMDDAREVVQAYQHGAVSGSVMHP
jgi:hypothetical protein